MDTLEELRALRSDLNELGDSVAAVLLERAERCFLAWRFEEGERFRSQVGMTLIVALCVAVIGLFVGCTDSDEKPSAESGGAASGSSTASSSTDSSSAPGPASSGSSSSTTETSTAPPAVRLTPDELLQSLRTQPFTRPDINDHLHVDGVAEAQYADGGWDSSIGASTVEIRSDIDGEDVSDYYDVFPDEQAATAIFDDADTNFRRFQDSSRPYRTMTVSPSVLAFCGAHPDGSIQCWLVHGVTTVNFNLRAPGGDIGTDDQAILQALLDHLIALGG